MRLTSPLIEISFATQLHTTTMKKIVAAILILIVVLNAIILVPKVSCEADSKECCVSKGPKIDLTEVNPGILPNLLKSTSIEL